MELTAKLSKEQWDYVLEVLSLVPLPQVRATAAALLVPQLEAQLQQPTQSA